MDTREEQELTIQIPHDGSQTERARGTYGGRQRWLNSGTESKTGTGTGTASILSPRTKTKLTAPSVYNYLNSLGISGEEHDIVNKEVNEVSIIRKDYDTAHNANVRKEQEIKKLQEEIQSMNTALSARVQDEVQNKTKLVALENKAALYELKLEEELSDRGVYNHMIQRLTGEALASKKATTEKEKHLETLQNELQTSMTTLLSARQEKSKAENTFKKLYKQWGEKHVENLKATDDIQLAVDQTKLKCQILEQREMVRKQNMQEAIGEVKMKEKRRVKHESMAQMSHYSEIQEELTETDMKLMNVEEEFKKIAEAAGTNDVDKIINKFLSRDETLRALKEEHAIADAKMRKLREKHKQFNEQLSNLRGSAVNTRMIYQEMDQTSEKLKDIEKDASVLSEKFNKANVLLDAFRACMLKCLKKLSSVHGSLDYDDHHELNRAIETPTAELLHMVEQKLNRVLDVINREKAERELHRAEASLGTHSPEGADKAVSLRLPTASETEEHFILRMSNANCTPGNVRVRPKAVGEASPSKLNSSPTKENCLSKRQPQGTTETGAATAAKEEDDEMVELGIDDDPVIDRHMRKKLVGLIVNRGKKTKKTSIQN